MRSNDGFPFLIKLGRWLFRGGLTVSFLALLGGAGAIAVSFARNGPISALLTAVQVVKWIFASLLLMTAGEVVMLLLAIHRNVRSMREEFSKLVEILSKREEGEGERTILDEFGIEIEEERSRG
ncbi:hypothetical protein DRP77_02950 [Candidatus Poribacteria bacterium]|nr:MAG: hypothetical protein DRP77_02950 [Candidatus Poribacteria bacterium]